MYSLVISIFVVSSGFTYGILTASWIRAHAIREALEAAETLGVTLADAVMLENQGALRARAEAAMAVIASLDARGESDPPPQVRAVDYLAIQRISDAGYFFVVDSAGEVAYHPYDEVRAANHADTPVVQRIITQRNGYVRYDWQNPSEPGPQDKFAYFQYYEPWDWFVVVTDYAAGFLSRMPPDTLRSLLDGYQRNTVVAAMVRTATGDVLGASRGWDRLADQSTATAAWAEGLRSHSRVESIDRASFVALAPLAGFPAEVGIVYSGERLELLLSKYIYVVALSLVLSVFLIYVSSRAASRVIARPVRLLSDRLSRRLGSEERRVTVERSDDLRTLVLQQLRTLVRLDYETKNRRAAEHEAIVAESVFIHTAEGILVTDTDSRIVRVNPAFEAMTGYRADELIGRNPRILRSKRHDTSFYRSMWDSLRDTGVWVGEIWNRRKSGEEYPQILSICAVQNGCDDQVGSYVAVCHDISDRKEAEDRLHFLATHDSLTGLPNRAYLSDVLEYSIRQARRDDSVVAVLFVDVDDFKDVNDSCGHEAGDQLLVWISRRLELQLRDGDTVVRFGGDEFVLLLPRIEDAEYASVVARRILASVREPYMIADQRFRPSVSIGIAVYPEAGREAGDLLRDADAAMYAAKHQGRNTYRFHNPDMNENAHRRLAMQGSVAVAIDRNEFFLVYQPILSLSDESIAGIEALVRWDNNGRVIMPGEFLPYLENSSMLTRLDLWVLDRVCLDISTSNGKSPRVPRVSVNVGAYNLIQDDFVHRATEIVSRNGVDPQRIAIEITESAAIRNFDRARHTLRDLQAAGFALFLDDFGAGHSSIRYLREFGVDSVKLDRTYLTNVDRSRSARSLVSGFAQLAHGMRLTAIMEGVETQSQLDFVRSAGCDFAQGYYIGMPGTLSDALVGWSDRSRKHYPAGLPEQPLRTS